MSSHEYSLMPDSQPQAKERRKEQYKNHAMKPILLTALFFVLLFPFHEIVGHASVCWLAGYQPIIGFSEVTCRGLENAGDLTTLIFFMMPYALFLILAVAALLAYDRTGRMKPVLVVISIAAFMNMFFNAALTLGISTDFLRVPPSMRVYDAIIYILTAVVFLVFYDKKMKGKYDFQALWELIKRISERLPRR